MAAATVSEVLRRFLPDFLRERPALSQAQRRALFAIKHCRTAVMGGHLHACGQCGTREFAWHSCNHRLHFHPHLHGIVPGAGLDSNGRAVLVKNENFLVPQRVLRRAFRARFREGLTALAVMEPRLPPLDDAVWDKDWGVHLQPFGSGERAIQYLGAYVSRTAIGDSRIAGLTEDTVTYRWKDRARGGAPRTESLPGVEFVRRYLRHVLPRGLKAIRYYGFSHPAAKAKREHLARATGCPPPAAPAEKPAAPARPC